METKINGVDEVQLYNGIIDFNGLSVEKTDNGQYSDFSTDNIRNRIRATDAYQSAYKLFSQDPDKSWLTQLEMIPSAFTNAETTIFDNIGLSNNAEDKDNATLQRAVEMILNLVNSYYTTKYNSETAQAQRLQNVGVNSAITGEGLDSAERAEVEQPTTDNTSLRSFNPIEGIAQIANVFSDFNNGVLGWAKALYDFSIQSQQLDINRGSLGLGFANLNLSQDELDFARESFDKNYKLATSSEGRQFYSMLKDWLDSGYKSVPSISSSLVGEISDYDINRLVNDSPAVASQQSAEHLKKSSSFINASLPDVSSDLLNEMRQYNKLNFDLFKLSIKRDSAIAKLQSAQADYQRGLFTSKYPNALSYGKYIAQLNDEVIKLNSRMAQHQYNYIESLYKRQQSSTLATGIYNFMMSGYDVPGYGLSKQGLSINRYNAATQRGSAVAGILQDGLQMMENPILMKK